MERSISPASRAPSGLNSTPNDDDAPCRGELADPGGYGRLTQHPTRFTLGAISLSSSNNLLLRQRDKSEQCQRRDTHVAEVVAPSAIS